MTASRSEKEKMLVGELYHTDDTELQADEGAAKAWMVRYNARRSVLTSENGRRPGVRRRKRRRRSLSRGDGVR